ncbi:unnamed protein product, partial [Symbiodinium sp. CCMP2456]
GEVSCHGVDNLLGRLPTVPAVEVDVTFTAANLLRVAGRLQSKAGGPDDWDICHFQALPQEFREALAALWQTVYSSGRVPKRWREARVCLVPKAAGGHRPISVLSIAYRLGASVLSRELRQWTDQWLGVRIMGGFHGRATRDVFMRVLHAAEDRLAMFVGEDVNKSFDSLTGPHVLRGLKHLQAPPQLLGFVESIMKEQWRVFSSHGLLGARWHLATKGAAQGDPISSLLAGAVMWAWSFWSSSGAGLLAAKRRSEEIDMAFQFRCDTRKCQLAARAQSQGREMAGSFGYAFRPSLDILGIVVDIAGRAPPVLARYAHDVANVRVQCINAVAHGMWGSGFHPRLGNSILAVTNYKHACDTPAIVVWEIMGWECCPSFARRWSALRDAIALTCRPPVWLEDADLTFAAKRSFVNLAGGRIAGALSSGAVTLWETFAVSSLGWTLLTFFASGCVTGTGLVLWLPPTGSLPLFIGETRDWPEVFYFPQFLVAVWSCFEATRRLTMARTVASAATRLWPRDAQCGPRRPSVAVSLMPPCECGLACPSRPHLLWQCPGTASLRPRCAAPVNRCEERLLAKVVPEQPPPPAVVGRDDTIEALATQLDVLFEDSATLYVGTDGSTVTEVGAWSVAVQGGETFACGICAEDQSPYRAEVEGLLGLLEAVQMCRRRGSIVVVCDCQAALLALDGKGQSCILVQRVRERLHSCISMGFFLSFYWVPSHGKMAPPRWLVPPGGEMLARTLNGRADVAARACASRRAAGSGRERCHAARADALVWERAAIDGL